MNSRDRYRGLSGGGARKSGFAGSGTIGFEEADLDGGKYRFSGRQGSHLR